MLRVVAGIIELDGYILLCQRHRDSKRFPLKWEFPGGKVEQGERPEDAIVRELDEELGICVKGIEKIGEYPYAYLGEPAFQLVFFKITDYDHTVKNLQFERTAWLRREELHTYDLLDGDKPFIDQWK